MHASSNDPVPKILHADLLRLAGRHHGFTTRLGGVSKGPFAHLNFSPKWPEEADAVRVNTTLLGRAARFDPRRLYRVCQVHGSQGVYVTDQAPESVRLQEADFLVTDRPGTTIGVLTADCVPVLIADPVGAGVAAVHAGWRGLVAGVLEQAVAALTSCCSARPDRLVAALGPSIGPCCFEVGHDVADQFSAHFGHDQGTVAQADPRPHVDLWRAARLALERAGLLPPHIADPPGCTMCAPDQFHSYRRDGARIGQQLSYIGLQG